MKDLSVRRRRTVRDLTLTLAIAFSIVLAGFSSALAGKTAPVQVGFLGVPPPHFQNVLLNVQAVRINPKANAAPNDPKWQRIGVAAGIGTGGITQPELQIDLNNSQNLPILLNTAKVKPAMYKIAQLILDPNNPGTLIPDCPNAGTPEGCINYPIQLLDAGAPINLIPLTQPLISANNNGLAQLVIQLTVMINTPPKQPGAPYLVTVSMAAIDHTTVLGVVSGSNVPGKSGTSAKHLRKLAVFAEPIGTNTEIANSPVKNGNYNISLPAASGPDSTFFGSLYDLVLAGGGDSFGAIRLQALFPGATINPPDFTNILTNQTLGSITGTIKDACTNTTIAGATVQLLLPPQNTAAVTDADCRDPVNFRECVSVASATTNNAGLFPLPGTITLPSAFEQIPVLSGDNRYSMMITAPGYDPTFTIANATTGKNGGNCNPVATSSTVMKCDFSLTRGTISGAFPIQLPNPGQTVLLEVFAEDSGTNNIVSALPSPITVRSTSNPMVPFAINVPTGPSPTMPSPRTFDLFATTIDSFQGISDPYQGHSIAVIQGVVGPAPPVGGVCQTIGPDATTTSSETIECVGHGSITGDVPGADLGTSVVLSKTDVHTGIDVMITNTPVQNTLPNLPASNAFSFCAPGDTYTIQKLQLPKPDQAATPLFAPTPLPTPPVVEVTIPLAPVVGGPTPTPTPSPTPTGGPTPTATPTGGPTPTLKCPTTCSNPGGTCPGICNNVGTTIPLLP